MGDDRGSDMRGRGLLDRFLYALPAGNIGYRQTTPEPVPDRVRADYMRRIGHLAAALYDLTECHTIALTPAAAEVLTTWREELEPRRRPDEPLGGVQGWASKLDGATVRIAGLLHLAATPRVTGALPSAKTR